MGTQESTAVGSFTVVENGHNVTSRVPLSSLRALPGVFISTAEKAKAQKLPDLWHPTANKWQRGDYGLNCDPPPQTKDVLKSYPQ